MKHLFAILGSAFVAATAGAADLTTVWGPRASFQVTFRVADDEGRPVEGAKFGCGWGRLGFRAPDAGQANLMTDRDGKAVVAAQSVFNEFNYHAEKPGYYTVRSVGYDRPLFRDRANGRWEPWNPTVEMVLKRIKNPVAMYAKNVELKVPEFDKPMGYDLIKGDWVGPYGGGEKPDLVFEVHRNVRSDRDYEGSLSLHFSNTADGLVPTDDPTVDGSELRLKYLAPEEGYIAQKVWREIRHPMPDGNDAIVSDTARTMSYYIRVRAIVDAQGRVISAYYGKIHGDIRFFIGALAPTSGLAFTYYLNPDGTRNVEFDPRRNLFKPANPNDDAFWNLGP
jgi:hypothetical protein